MKSKILHFSENEVTIIQLALISQKEDLEIVINNTSLEFTPQATAELENMMRHTESAIKKLELAAGRSTPVAEFKPGDEKEFLIQKK